VQRPGRAGGGGARGRGAAGGGDDAAGGASGSGSGEDVVDADFEEIPEDERKKSA
jgi:hypothetical protein